MSTPIKNSWSSFWLGQDSNWSESPVDDKNLDFVDIIKLSIARRAVSNFVNILTERSIPVHFISTSTGFTDGKSIFISSEIVDKRHFDPAVGLALHEASHVVLTDFDLIKTLWGRISELYKIGKDIGLDKSTVQNFAKLMVNYVEDRFIDNYIFKTAPGYRPYYISLYDRVYNNSLISEYLISQEFRYPCLKSYEFRIINFTNPKTDLTALPGLRKIAETLCLRNINRLKTTKDRISVATEIVKIVFNEIKDFKQPKSMDGESIKISFDLDREDEMEIDDLLNKSSKNNTENEDDIIGGYQIESDAPAPPKEKNKEPEKLTSGNVKIEKINKQLEKQKSFIQDHSDSEKKAITSEKSGLVSIIEESGVTLVPTGMKISTTNVPNKGVECVVVKKMTEALVFSGMFPMCDHKEYYDRKLEEAVIRGIQLGTMLGNKLQIRQETNVTKYIRKSSGKINKRLLSEIANGYENIFYNTKYDKYDKLNLHISVDASSSMSGDKWYRTMTMVVAICKAASMVNNLKVSVSFRCTIESVGKQALPYVVLAYDSSTDKFDKVKRLFKHLNPHGNTPEGLVFEATMSEIINKNVDEIYYFLTISDGQPAFSYWTVDDCGKQISISYDMISGAKHTRSQFKKIKDSGVKCNAYFIKSDYMRDGSASEICFKEMYGSDARFIDVNNVIAIAKTMNDLFLEKK